MSNQQLAFHLNRFYKEILKQQVREHQHLFISPILLVLFAIPHVILAFCIK
ncbi:unnamed protein product, partial [Rotaria sordida]